MARMDLSPKEVIKPGWATLHVEIPMGPIVRRLCGWWGWRLRLALQLFRLGARLLRMNMEARPPKETP